MKISIIIPNYNGEALLKKNLPAVLKAAKYFQSKSGDEVEIIVVDDGSTDSSESVISNFQFPSSNFQLIRNRKNLGFSSTVNRGVKDACGELVVLLNTDVSPEEDFLIPLLKHFEDPNIFAVGCMDKSMEEDKIVLRGRGLGRWEKGFLIHRKGEVDKINTLWVSGGSGAFRKNIWQKLGGLNELYNPFYWEDIDISYRALKSGYKILFEPKSIVVHEHIIGAIKSKYSSSKIKTIAYRNQFIFVWNNSTNLTMWSHLAWLPYHFLVRLKSKDWNFFVGFFNALILFPKIIKSSSRAKKLFVMKDRDVIASINETIY